MAYEPDINAMRQNYANALAQQQQKALRGVQDIYAQRGTTGSGEEAVAFGELGNQFGAAAGLAENQLQQYLGGLGMQQAQLAQQESQFGRNLGQQESQFGRQFGLQQQQFGEGQRQFDVGQGNWQKQFGEGQRQFDIGQGNWQQQFGANLAQQQFGNQMSLLPLIQQGYLSQDTAFGAIPGGNQGMIRAFDQQEQQQGQFGGSPFGRIKTDADLYQSSPEYAFAKRLGYSDPTQMAYAAQADPEWFKNLMYNKGIFGENMMGGQRDATPSIGGGWLGDILRKNKVAF